MPLRGLTWGAVLWLLTGSILGSPWRFSNPHPHGTHIYDMEFRDGLVWQIGDRGRVYTSADLDQWAPHETGTTRSLRGITFFGSNVFISGEEGTILSGSSPDVLRLQSITTTNWLEGIAASPAKIVTVGDNGAIYSSTGDGTWTKRGSFNTWLRGVAWGGNQFLCVGEDGFIARSTEGDNWEQLSSGTTAHLNRALWIDDRFWIVGDQGTVLTNNSPTGFLRVNVGVTNTLFTVTANSNEVVIAGDSVVLLGNKAGGSWVPQADLNSPTLAPLWPYYSSLWDGRLFLLGGHAGMIVEGFRTNATAPLVWYSEIQPTRSWLWSVTRLAHLYTAVGVDGAVITSEDGIEWDREVVPPVSRAEILLGIGGNTNVMIAAGSKGTILRSENVLTNVVSTNELGELVTSEVNVFGVLWTKVPVASLEDLQGVAANQSIFLVTGGAGAILTSTDAGSTWVPRFSGVTSYLSGATAWPQGFVVVGAGGVILTSGDGVLWQRRNSGVQEWVYAVRWLGGQLVAVGENGLILTSPNGSDWTRRSSGTTEWLNDVTYAGGKWYIAGSRGMIVSSADGAAWTATKAITSNSLYGAATDGEQLIFAGLEGTVLRRSLNTAASPVNILSFEHVGPNSVFLFSGVIDQQFVLEKSSAVTGPWTPVATLELTEPPGTLLYQLPSNDSRAMFFRTRLLPVP